MTDEDSAGEPADGPATGGSADRPAAGPARAADSPVGESGDRSWRWSPALVTLVAIGLLLIGFAVGVVAGNPLRDKADAAAGAVDVGFCQDMSVHHTQAVQMAGLELSGGADPDIRRLAYDILTTQQNQAGRMQGWLQLWGRPTVAADGYMSWMTEPSAHEHGMPHATPGPVASMPGMATQQEMEQLRRATGPALDTLFLQLMLRHHQGGGPMIDYARAHADTDAVRSLADSMNATQQSEIRLMTSLLTARGAPTLPLG
ncbi:DUF305 domain-containing protein [Nocardia blacklockiae]|uniref:DUF305 domain-containing protein n=1 Tax=Nocardia blacklockiae TaxID=480036 RepID=UPI00189506E5|nr:DUF305 domain-containing protein [Nocardia blacklockiae]MBF6172397.1 DUF305 domain-containing protein [Nocardia blacklockiae]